MVTQENMEREPWWAEAFARATPRKLKPMHECGACRGRGWTQAGAYGLNPGNRMPDPESCGVCGGTGRVVHWKHRHSDGEAS